MAQTELTALVRSHFNQRQQMLDATAAAARLARGEPVDGGASSVGGRPPSNKSIRASRSAEAARQLRLRRSHEGAERAAHDAPVRAH